MNTLIRKQKIDRSYFKYKNKDNMDIRRLIKDNNMQKINELYFVGVT